MMDADALFDALLQNKNESITALQSSLDETRKARETLALQKARQDDLIKQLQTTTQKTIQDTQQVYHFHHLFEYISCLIASHVYI